MLRIIKTTIAPADLQFRRPLRALSPDHSPDLVSFFHLFCSLSGPRDGNAEVTAGMGGLGVMEVVQREKERAYAASALARDVLMSALAGFLGCVCGVCVGCHQSVRPGRIHRPTHGQPKVKGIIEREPTG